MGISYANQGMYEDSICYYVRALSMNPKADNAWQYLRISFKEKALGRMLSWYEQYKDTHTRKKKDIEVIEWVSEEAKDVVDEYERKLQEKHGDYETVVEELTDPGLEVWKNIVGVKRGKLLRRPKEKWSSRHRTLPSLQFQVQDSAREMKKIKDKLAIQKKKDAARD